MATARQKAASRANLIKARAARKAWGSRGGGNRYMTSAKRIKTRRILNPDLARLSGQPKRQGIGGFPRHYTAFPTARIHPATGTTSVKGGVKRHTAADYRAASKARAVKGYMPPQRARTWNRPAMSRAGMAGLTAMQQRAKRIKGA